MLKASPLDKISWSTEVDLGRSTGYENRFNEIGTKHFRIQRNDYKIITLHIGQHEPVVFDEENFDEFMGLVYEAARIFYNKGRY